jgi:hypothetical protein
MPRVPLYSGPIASAVMPQSFTPRDTGIFAQGGQAVSGIEGQLLRRLFFGKQVTPQQELARKYGAEADAEAYKLEQAKTADTARSGLANVFDELNYRTGRDGRAGPTSPVTNIVDEVPYTGPAAVPVTPAEEASRMRAAGGRALTGALAQGADAKQTTPLMQAFALSMGDDNEIVRTNAALEGKYLGDTQAPSLEAQVAKIEDAQKQEMEIEDGKRRMQKYGFDTASADRRYDTDVDAGTARRGQDISSGNTRRGQDMTDARSRKDTEGYQTVVEDYPATRGTPGKGKFLGIFGEEKKATPGTPKRKVVTKVPIKGGAPAPAGKKKLKYNPATGQLE